MSEHLARIDPVTFQAIFDGVKTHQLLKVGETKFAAGDTVRFVEKAAETDDTTGRELRRSISYVTSIENPCALSEFGLNPEFAILSIAS